ncbi:peptidase P60 [Clostridioides difficile]
MRERRVIGNYHARCEVRENLEIKSKSYLSLSIGYADLNNSYWQQHLIGAGRVK